MLGLIYKIGRRVRRTRYDEFEKEKARNFENKIRFKSRRGVWITKESNTLKS
jgi:hypothetical protein